MRLRTLITLGLALPALSPAHARWKDTSAGQPFVETHPATELTVSGIWSIVEDARGRLYAGSDSVLEFDGVTWSVIPTGRGNTIFRLAVDATNRIWCGGANELGYLDEDETGARSYHSLHDRLPQSLGAFFVRGVHCLHDRVLFVLDDSLLVWSNGSFDHRPLPTPREARLVSFDFAGAAYVSQPAGGLFRWDGTSLEKIPWADGSPEQFHAAWFDAASRPVFLGSQSLTRIENGAPVRFAETTARELVEARISTAVRLPDDIVAVATTQKGVFLLDDDGAIVRTLTREDGLPNLAVMTLHRDRADRLWVGAYSPIVCAFNAAHRQSFFNSRNGLSGDVAAFAYSPHTGVLGGTVEGLGRLVPRARRSATFEPLPFLPNATGEVFTLPDDRVLLTALGSLWRIDADHAEVLAPCTSTYYQAALLDLERPRFALGERARLFAWDLDENPPRPREIAVLPEHPTRLVGDRRGSLWASMRRTGIVWIPDAGGAGAIERHFEPGRDLPLPFNDPAVFVLDGMPYAYTTTSIVALPQDPAAAPRIVADGLGLWAAERIARGAIWAIAQGPGRSRQLVRLQHDPAGSLHVHVTNLSIPHIGNITVATRTQDHFLWIGGSEGTIRIDTREVGDEPEPAEPFVQAASWRTGEHDTRITLSDTPHLKFHRSGALTLRLRDRADPLNANPSIETRLLHASEPWHLTGGSRTITDLNEGTHTLEARTVSFLGDPGPVIRYTFTIAPPWFRTPLAYLGYVFAFGGSLYGAAQWRTRRIRRQNVQLEQLVNRRTEELAQAVSARSAFLANMGHEIRNPLNGVVGLVDTLRSRELAAEQKGIVDRIGTCADQLISVIDDVLEYARIDAGRIALRNRVFVVREPVEAAIDILRAARPDAEIELQGAPTDLDPSVVGDPDRIRHILVNYVSNALKFGGGTPVQVGVRRDGPLLVFSVTDHGPGITPEEQARLFVRFSRGSQAYRHGIPGTGLGLAACKAYAEAMGGDVSVESEPGRGATFYLRLPFQPATADTSRVVAHAPDLMVGKRALVVDDQDFNRFVLTDLLGRMGASTDQAANIDEARAAFRARTPDIVFVDFDLAGATGADLAAWIRHEAPAGRDVPVVATTAFEVDEVRRRCEEAGMDGFLPKPVTAQRLAEVVGRIESIRSGGAAPATASLGEDAPAPSSFLDILAGGDPDKRREIERSTWREVLVEALTAHRALRRGDAALIARHAHRLVSAALILSERELVAAARELNAVAKADDLSAAQHSAARLRQLIRKARRRTSRHPAPTSADTHERL